MDANILPPDPLFPASPQTVGVGSFGQISTFSKHGHVVYHIHVITNIATW